MPTNAEHQRKWRERNPDKRREYWNRYYEKNKERLAPVYRERATNRRKRERDAVFDHYGSLCRCCGETQREFLNLDHKNNDGGDERRKFGVAGSYARCIKAGFPDTYQILCFN